MAKKYYHYPAKCPSCGKLHDEVRSKNNISVPYTGTCRVARIYCKECITARTSTSWSSRDWAGPKKSRIKDHIPVHTQAMSDEEKRKYNLQVELEGRRFSKKLSTVSQINRIF